MCDVYVYSQDAQHLEAILTLDGLRQAVSCGTVILDDVTGRHVLTLAGAQLLADA